MSSTPVMIHVKRRRDDEPVDALYVQREGGDAREGLPHQIYRRMPTSPYKRTKSTTEQLSGDASAEAVQADQPLEARILPKDESEVVSGRNQKPATKESTVQVPDLKFQPTIESTLKRDPDPETPSSVPYTAELKKTNPLSVQSRSGKRVFHLSHSTTRSLRHSASNSSLNGIRKRQRVHGSKIAIFTEQRKAKLMNQLQAETQAAMSDARILRNDKSGASVGDDSKTNHASAVARDTHLSQEKTTSQKRPTASAAEKEWRNQHWSSKTSPPIRASKASIGEDERTLALATELQKFAMSETMSQLAAPELAPEPSTKVVEPGIQARKPLKFAPKPPPPRNNARKPFSIFDLEIMKSDENVETSRANDNREISEPLSDSEDWVLDTFMLAPERVPTPSLQKQDTHTSAISLPQAESASPDGLGEAKDSRVTKVTLRASMTANENIGYLIIRNEDEEAWEWYAQSEDEAEREEREFDDDADSNAESFYANSYPSSDADAEFDKYVLSDNEEEWLGSEYEESGEEGMGVGEDDDS